MRGFIKLIIQKLLENFTEITEPVLVEIIEILILRFGYPGLAWALNFQAVGRMFSRKYCNLYHLVLLPYEYISNMEQLNNIQLRDHGKSS